VSQKTHEHFTVAVCIILMCYSLKEATDSVNAEKPRAQVRAGPVQQHCMQDLGVNAEKPRAQQCDVILHVHGSTYANTSILRKMHSVHRMCFQVLS
jgi:hypothetical protein